VPDNASGKGMLTKTPVNKVCALQTGVFVSSDPKKNKKIVSTEFKINCSFVSEISNKSRLKQKYE